VVVAGIINSLQYRPTHGSLWRPIAVGAFHCVMLPMVTFVNFVHDDGDVTDSLVSLL